MANFTRRAIKESFLKLLNQRPLNQITIKDIVEDCGINRNSFYYHFEDLPALVETFRSPFDLLERLEGDGRFFSPHRAYIVNLEFIQGLAGGELLLSNGRRLPVARKQIPQMKKAYLNYAF